jgi:tRNA 2-thiouridine synthesizing protein B
MKDIFILTKAPRSSRSRLCLDLMAQSKDPKLYLACDGVYHLLGDLLIPDEKISASKEDMEARGIQSRKGIELPDDFYSRLVEDIMEHSRKVYSF